MDGVGARGEYLRYGTKFDQLRENILRYQDIARRGGAGGGCGVAEIARAARDARCYGERDAMWGPSRRWARASSS